MEHIKTVLEVLNEWEKTREGGVVVNESKSSKDCPVLGTDELSLFGQYI